MKTVTVVNIDDMAKLENFYNSKGIKLKLGDKVIVNNAQGLKFGTVHEINKKLDEKIYKSSIGTIKRKATLTDIEKNRKNTELAKKAYDVCQKNIMRLNISMKLVKVEVLFDVSKILFYFTADGRVDFRELVKSLALIFKTRIELRQVGIRDKARIVGGVGACGRELCCKSYLSDFQPVSMKMAREQGLSLNPINISGVCTRLMCCLKYEQNSYEYLIRKSPKLGDTVETEDGNGVVVDLNLILGVVKVSLSSGENIRPKSYNIEDVKIIKTKEKK